MTYVFWIIRNWTAWPFNCVETIDFLIELLLIHDNTWNNLLYANEWAILNRIISVK